MELIRRELGKRRYLVAMNFGRSEETVSNLPAGRELLTGKRIGSSLTIPGYGVAIIEHT